jgi:hypothetical protein
MTMAKYPLDWGKNLERLDEAYTDGQPEWIKEIHPNYLVIMVADWTEKPKKLKVTVADVIKYYHGDARNITSGMRSLAGFAGDWRNIDALAKECLEIFKIINRPALEKEGKKFGMELK